MLRCRLLNDFLLTRPHLSLEEVPMFFITFHSGTPRHREERLWILQLLRLGLRTAADAALCAQRHVLQLVLSLHDSHLADAQAEHSISHSIA
jgi:hypothetical protein